MSSLPDYAISVRQPWAWAIIHAGKDIENRLKRAITMGSMDKHRHLAIHAASGMTRDEYEDAAEFMTTIGVQCPRPDALVRGAIIGAVTVTGICKASKSPWFFGPWGLELIDAISAEPLPCRGLLGAFRWQPNLIEAVREPLPWMIAWPNKPGRSQPEPKSAAPLLL